MWNLMYSTFSDKCSPRFESQLGVIFSSKTMKTCSVKGYAKLDKAWFVINKKTSDKLLNKQVNH